MIVYTPRLRIYLFWAYYYAEWLDSGFGMPSFLLVYMDPKAAKIDIHKDKILKRISVNIEKVVAFTLDFGKTNGALMGTA